MAAFSQTLASVLVAAVVVMILVGDPIMVGSEPEVVPTTHTFVEALLRGELLISGHGVEFVYGGE